MLTAWRRRGWVLLVTVLLSSGAAFAVALVRGTTYTAESTAVVLDRSRQAVRVVTPDQANALAPTYASLLPQDSAFLRHLAVRLGTRPGTVRARISVTSTPGTALLVITYRHPTSGGAVAGARAALDAVVGPAPVTRNVLPRSVSAVREPTTATASTGPATLVGLGAIAGLALGLLLVLVWERVDPRIDRPEDLSDEVGSPTSPAEDLSEAGVRALLTRWQALADPGPRSVALVPATPEAQAGLAEVAGRLTWNGTHGTWPEDGRHRSGTNGVRPTESARLEVVLCPLPSSGLTALRPIMECDLVVLVARQGTSRLALRDLISDLSEFGVSPRWAIFLGSGVEEHRVRAGAG